MSVVLSRIISVYVVAFIVLVAVTSVTKAENDQMYLLCRGIEEFQISQSSRDIRAYIVVDFANKKINISYQNKNIYALKSNEEVEFWNNLSYNIYGITKMDKGNIEFKRDDSSSVKKFVYENGAFSLIGDGDSAAGIFELSNARIAIASKYYELDKESYAWKQEMECKLNTRLM